MLSRQLVAETVVRQEAKEGAKSGAGKDNNIYLDV
jgi:hypothetical protein